MSPYRDSLAGLRSQVAAKRAVVGDRGRRLSVLVHAMLPSPLARTTAETLVQVEVASEDLEGLAALDAALERLLAAYDEALRLAPSLCACPLDVPDFAHPFPPEPWLIEEGAQLALRAAATERIRALTDGDASVVRWGDRAYLSRLSVGAPLVFCTSTDIEAGPTAFSSRLRTSLPATVASMAVRCESALRVALRVVGFGQKATFDPIFDRMFSVDTSDAALGLLVDDVRHAMTTMSSLRPSLTTGGGLAELAWHGASHSRPNDVLPDAALRVLTSLRDAITRSA